MILFSMNRKKLLITIIVITAAITISMIVLNNQINLKKLSIEQNKWNSILSSRTENNNLKLESIKFNDYSLLIDENNSSLYYSVVGNMSNKYDPDVTFIASDENVKIAVLNDEITDEKIANNYQFKIVIYNDSEYRLYSLVCTNLPMLNIEYNTEISREKNIPIDVYLFNNLNNSVNRVAKSSGRLNILEDENDKKDYTFSLLQKSLGRNERENNISILNMNKHNEYILNSMNSDDEKIRNVFSTNLWNETTEERYDSYNYVELFINGEYVGLYSLGYNIEREKMRLGRDEFMFLKSKFSDSESTMKENIKPEGYILYNHDIDKIKRNDETKEIDEWAELYNYYEVINGNDVTKIKEVCDIDNSIKIYLFYMLIQASDNVNEETFSNTYLLFKNLDQSYFVRYFPWNLNNTFNDDASNNEYIMKYNPINRLIELNDEETIEKIKEIYFSLRNSCWSEDNINNMLNSYENKLFKSGAFLRDSNKWNDSKLNDLSEFKEYVTQRLKYMDEYINNL